MKTVALILAEIVSTVCCLGQTAVDVMESTIKISAMSEESLFLGFAEGDKIVLDFREVNGKDLKELEVIEFPSSTKFAEFKVDRIENKIINVPRTSIFIFRFSNSAITGRICRIHIQRIPATTTTQIFNTAVFWRTVTDTIHSPVQERYLVKADTSVVTVVDQIAKVSSQTALNGNPNLTVVDIDLPKETTAWSYYIGVGKEGQEAFDVARDKFVATAAKQVSKIDGYGTMAALAIHGLNYFAQVQGRDNVKYWIIPDWDNVLLFQSRQSFQTYKSGDVINDASRMVSPIHGKLYLGLANDNMMESIEVVVKVVAMRVIEQWETRVVNKIQISRRNEPYLK